MSSGIVASSQQVLLPIKYITADTNTSTNFLPQKIAALSTVEQVISVTQLAAYKAGFIGISVDSCVKTDSNFIAWVYLGKPYHWKAVTGLPNLTYSSDVSLPTIWQTIDDLLRKDAAVGYPFAAIELLNWQVVNDSISAEFSYKKGAYTKWLPVVNRGAAKLGTAFLNRYLNIAPNSTFSEQQFLEADALLSSLPYVTVTKPTELVLSSGGASLNTYLQSKAANEINALIGFLPQNPVTGGRTQIVGDAVVHLRNIFNGGEALYINWQQLQPASPRLQLQYTQPFVAGSKYSLATQFELFRRDSSFLQLQLFLKLSVPLGKRQFASIGYQLQSSSLLTVDTNRLLVTGRLPNELDFVAQSIVVGYNYGRLLEYERTGGWQVNMLVQAGSKRIQKNNTITELKGGANFDEMYQSLNLNSFQFIAKPTVQKHWLLGKSALLKASATGAVLFTDRVLFNEVFQIGGIKLLRGFNEQQFFVNKYAVSTVEYKYFIAPESCLYGFADMGWLNQPFLKNGNGIATGIGAGIYLKTGTGILNLAWAVGRFQNEPFNFRQSKLHIGFSALL